MLRSRFFCFFLIGFIQMSHERSEGEIKAVLQELQCREAGPGAVLVWIVLSERRRQGEWRADWHRYIFCSS